MMIGLVKENASNISNNIVRDGVYANENSKSHSINSQSQRKEHKRAPKKNKSVGDSAFRVFANNFMSLFGYGDSAQPAMETGSPGMPECHRKNIGRQNASDIMGVERSRNDTVAVGTDVEEEEPSGHQESQASESNREPSVPEAPVSLGTKFGQSGKTEYGRADKTSSLASEKNYSQLQIIAHVSGRPVHAKYSYGKNKFKIAHKHVEQLDAKGSVPEVEGGSTSSHPRMNSILVHSPVMQFRQVPVQMAAQQHPVVYNTPLITQRVIPQTNKIIYQPVYTHSQVEMASNGLVGGPVGGGLVQRSIYSPETAIGANAVFAGKDVHGGVLNAMPKVGPNLSNSVGKNQIIGFGTPLVGYRSMSHVPSNMFIKMDSNQPGVDILDVSRETRLQSSNETVLSNSGHPRNGTGGSLASTGSVCQPISSFGLGAPIKVKVQDEEKVKKKEGLEPDSQNPPRPRQVVRTSNGSLHTLSLTTTSSSDTGSVTMSQSTTNTKAALDSSGGKAGANSAAKEEDENVQERPEDGGGHSAPHKGFIPQASPVVNYRSTLDYLVTPMVRYRDIASNLKVRTVPPQLSSNDACKYATVEAPGNAALGSSNGSNSPRNMNVMGSNEYKETVYTPVAPIPVVSNYPVVPGVAGGPGLAEMLNPGLQSSGHMVVPGVGSAENSLLKQVPVFNTQGSNPISGMMLPSGSQGGRILNGGLKSHMYRVPVGIPQNLGYRLVRTNVKSHASAVRVPAGGGVGGVGSSVHKENLIKEENVGGNRNSHARKGYVNKMYKYLADSSQFPPLPKEILIEDIEFLTRPVCVDSNPSRDRRLVSNSTKDGETNVSLVKGSSPGKGREWDSINRGTFCTVYKVRHGDCVAAVKCPQKRIHDSDPLMSRYRCYTEWKLLYRCNRHPNILNLIGGIRINEYEIWLVTEYIKTGDLFKLIHGNGSRSKAFRESVEYRYKVMYQLADSIRFLHSLSPKIVHKDLKSNNILVDENFNIRICDFGDAEELHYNVITCCTAVTWQYAPPEIVGCSDPARPNSNANEKVDVWSMGCIFLEILCRRTPLQHILDKVEESGKHSTLYNLIHSNRIEGELRVPPLPDSLYNLITMCLRPNPDLRASSKEVFDFLVNNEKKILMQLSYINQYKLAGYGQ